MEKENVINIDRKEEGKTERQVKKAGDIFVEGIKTQLKSEWTYRNGVGVGLGLGIALGGSVRSGIKAGVAGFAGVVIGNALVDTIFRADEIKKA